MARHGKEILRGEISRFLLVANLKKLNKDGKILLSDFVDWFVHHVLFEDEDESEYEEDRDGPDGDAGQSSAHLPAMAAASRKALKIVQNVSGSLTESHLVGAAVLARDWV